jgi:tRNA pseudouridine55 synthase
VNNLTKPLVVDNTTLTEELSKDISDYPEGLLFVIDKPYGWTSADAVRKLKFMLQRWFGVKKIKTGHAGTLDPLATGILLICAGKATKLAETYQASEKEYVAGIRFGATTPSFDLEKEIDTHYPKEHITQQDIQSVLEKHFRGPIDQIPPLFSAKLINGTRAYEIARAGKDAQIKPSTVTIHNTEILSWNPPDLTLCVKCSKGTYIRSIARDLGTLLESGAHLISLERVSSGEFHMKNALSFEKLKPFFE